MEEVNEKRTEKRQKMEEGDNKEMGKEGRETEIEEGNTWQEDKGGDGKYMKKEQVEEVKEKEE